MRNVMSTEFLIRRVPHVIKYFVIHSVIYKEYHLKEIKTEFYNTKLGWISIAYYSSSISHD